MVATDSWLDLLFKVGVQNLCIEHEGGFSILDLLGDVVLVSVR